MTTPALHPVLGTPLPAPTVQVQRERRDWPWADNARRRRRLVALVLEHKGRTCHLCGGPGATVADHLVPWSHGGPNVLENLEPAHHSCNSQRGHRTLADWFAHRPPVARPALAPSRSW